VSSRLIGTAVLVAAVGSGIVGGVLFAFSALVMRALDDLEPPHAIRAMQAINVRAVNPIFMGLLFGAGLLTVVVAGVSLVCGERDTGRRLTAAFLYITTIAVTAAYHVPRNDAFARVNPTSTNAAQIWHAYASGWTNWNHLRTLTAIASSALMIASAVAWRGWRVSRRCWRSRLGRTRGHACRVLGRRSSGGGIRWLRCRCRG
jgi:uncharacterized membrane protein